MSDLEERGLSREKDDPEAAARLVAVRSRRRTVCPTCEGLGGRPSRYAPGYRRLEDGRLDGWTIGGKKDCATCGGSGFAPEANS